MMSIVDKIWNHGLPAPATRRPASSAWAIGPSQTVLEVGDERLQVLGGFAGEPGQPWSRRPGTWVAPSTATLPGRRAAEGSGQPTVAEGGFRRRILSGSGTEASAVGADRNPSASYVAAPVTLDALTSQEIVGRAAPWP